jgi:hypothetical protein
MRMTNDPIREVAALRSASKKAQSIFLTGAEDILLHDPVAYSKIRKIFLDCINDFTRETAKLVVGEVEDLFK